MKKILTILAISLMLAAASGETASAAKQISQKPQGKDNSAQIVLENKTDEISEKQDNIWNVKTKYDLQKKMNEIGTVLLNTNRITERFTFMAINRVYTRDTWADVSSVNRTIWVKPDIIPYLDSSDELAAVLSHQIAHGIDTYEGIFRGYISILNYWVAPNKYDQKADKSAVDFMVNAGYNPLALITIMNKIQKQYRYDIFSNHSLASRRMMQIYEYIYTKYPAILIDNPLSDNIYYQNFLLTSRDNRMLLLEKVKANSTKQIQYKY